MRRAWWFTFGFFFGLGFFGLVAVTLMTPTMRDALLEGGEGILGRVVEAIRSGKQAAREREAQLERELEPDEFSLGAEVPDYVV